jgi:membrane-associated protease RseP (regulator of RpoE activity)
VTDFPGEPAFPPAGYPWAPPARERFQHNYSRHLLLFLLTLVTTTLTPVWMALFAFVNPLPLITWPVIASGLSYSIPVLTILSAHEFGHYFACRYYRVDATLPYFIPAPLPLTGTLGAVIRIREAFPSKRALFDIGVAGPIAGFVALVPLLWFGMNLSEVIRVPTEEPTLYFGEPLMWKALERLHFGVIPDGMDVALHPVGFAAWWGMLATALNLLPFGQLDGGHIMYASLGRRAAWLSGLSLLAVLVLAMRSASWVSMAVMMLAMAMLFGFRHPRIVDEHEPLDGRRQLVAVIAAIIFLLCFTPVPIELVGG